ncbi:MAG: hypothetical protein JO200_13840 [Comamonas sp.]|nr:hypothetical protein [Comamonas sp.]
MPDDATQHPAHKQRHFLRALALASLAIAGLALPFVWDVLAAINELPKMAWLQHVLALMPAASWLMMFVWGGAIPLVLLLNAHQTPPHKLRTIVEMLVLMWIAITWYVHMPASSQCSILYEHWGLACSVLQWAYSLSLGLATAAYVFIMLGLGISAMGLFAEGLDDETAHAS